MPLLDFPTVRPWRKCICATLGYDSAGRRRRRRRTRTKWRNLITGNYCFVSLRIPRQSNLIFHRWGRMTDTLPHDTSGLREEKSDISLLLLFRISRSMLLDVRYYVEKRSARQGGSANNYYREKSTLQFNQFSRPTGGRQTHRKPVSLETGMQAWLVPGRY